MKRIIGFFAVIVCSVIYFVSDNADLTMRYMQYRDRKPFIRFEKYQYGDLYGLSNLSEFREDITYAPRIVRDTNRRNINLYVFCDSYLHHMIAACNFRNVKHLTFLRWWYLVTAERLAAPNTSKHNVIVVEMTERFTRDIGEHPDYAYDLLKVGPAPVKTSAPVYYRASFSPVGWRFLNPHLSSNLEFNVFDYPLFDMLKDWKAEFNYHVFHRVAKEVTVDASKHQLYFTPTLARGKNTSSFDPVSDTEIGNIVHHFNELYRHYKALGFERIYLSIIPNPVTCIDPGLGVYNRLIPRIYAVDSLLLRPVNMYPMFRKHPQRYYLKSDSHWNNTGLQAWIDVMNHKLENDVEGEEEGGDDTY